MIVVVSDRSPINYLVLCNGVQALPALYERIVIPPAVHAELISDDAPLVVQHWAKNSPAWLTVQAASNLDPSLPLDPGECEAICLAQEIHADALIVDEAAA